MPRSIWFCTAALVATISTLRPVSAEPDTGLEVRFVDKHGTAVESRQLGSWVELQNLSTDEILSLRVSSLSNLLSVPKLSPGLYKLSVRHKQTRFDTCGARRQHWKLRIKPGEINRFTLTVHLINGTGCLVE